MTTLQLRPLERGDLGALARCHARVFGAERALSERELEWGSFGNPAGARAFVACAGERIVGAYLGRAARTWIGGEVRCFVQSVDSMIDPEFRAGLKRPGLFVNLAREYFDAYGVHGEDLVHYGWPIEQAWRIGERFLEYRLLREELVLVRAVGEGEELAQGVERLEELGEDLKWLWDRCAPAWGAATVRDAEWARWRFREHPTARYELLGVRDDAGVLRGMCALRTSEWSWPGALALCDWLVPDDEPEVARRLEQAALACAREHGAAQLMTLLPEWSGAFASFQDHGWRVRLSPYRHAARSFDKRFDLAWLRAHWWTTLADSDFGMNTLLLTLTLALCSAQVDELPLLELTTDDTRVSESVRIVIPERAVIPDANGDGVLHVVADGVTIVFEPGSVLRGAPQGVAPDQLSGVGVRIEGRAGVRIAGLKVRGYKVGLHATSADGLLVAEADLSDNFAQRLHSTPERCDDGADWLACHDNDANQWLTRYGAGIYVEDSSGVIVRGSRARRTQNGLLLDRVDSAQIYDNDFSFLSGWGLGLWRSSDNVVAHNAFDFCIRGYSHGVYNRGQDSAGILVFEQCSRNVFADNSATHGGDGVFGFAGSEALGQGEPLPRGFDATRRGNNDNLFLGNDFSYAAAHGLEMTFSFGNVVERNRFVGNAICGIWGGYSRGMLIQQNLFEENGAAGYGLERGGVNIEHAVENWILDNRFVRNACGVHLWWDADEGLAATPWAQANLTSCEQNAIVGNTFAGDELAIQLRLCKPTIVRENEMLGVEIELEAAEGALSSVAMAELPAPQEGLRFVGTSSPVGARTQLAGRDKIVMGEWGPWDHESPFVQLVERRADRHVYALHEFSEAVEASVVGAGVELELLAGAPARVQLTCSGRGYFPYTLSAGGQRRSGVLERVAWEVACFALTSDPREDEQTWQVAAARALPQMRAALDLEYAQGGPADLGFDVGEAVGRDHFGTLARAAIALPAGRYRLTVNSDDGVRVYVDGERLIDNWTWHAPTEDTAEFELDEAGEVELRVEHFELDGYALLQLGLSPVR